MELAQRIQAFSKLGDYLLSNNSNSGKKNYWQVIEQAYIHNPWFTPEFCEYSISSIAKEWLTINSLTSWTNAYPSSYFTPKTIKKVGVVMAGNVPFVGFHDMLCVLISGNIFIGKLSSKDGGLMQKLIDLLIGIEPRFSQYITMVDGKLEGFDAVIATGSDNSARYFDYYFGRYPNIIRHNRHSIAVLNGNEDFTNLQGLASDIFLYFGLGCRNVSKLLVPIGYNFDSLFKAAEHFQYLYNHNKYANNYEYHRAIYLMNQVEHLDNGFFIIKPDSSLGSPVGVVYYQPYSNIESVNEYISVNSKSIQCVVSNCKQIVSAIPFGQAQKPFLTDYADGIDTIEFLNGF
jgi:hypothetical protein